MKNRAFLLVIVLLAIAVTGAVWASGEQGVPAAQKEGPPNFEGKTVNVLLMASGPVLKYGELSADFEARTGAKVNLSIVPVKQYDAKVDTELISKQGAWDVIWIPWRTYHRWINPGWFAPMDPYLNDPQLVDEDLLGIDGFFDLSMRSLQKDGKQMALPILTGGAILYYRQDVYEKNGIGSAPDTWAEVEAIAKKIHTDEVAGFNMRASKKGGGVGFMWPSVLEAYGGSIVKDFPADMHPTLDSPEATEAAEWFARMIQNYGFPGGLTAHWKELVIGFQQGQIAMLPEAYLLSGQILDPEKSIVVEKTAYTVIPKGPVARISAGAVHGLGIPSNAPQKELGYKYIEWALSEEIQMQNCLKHHVSSTTRGAIMNSSQYLEMFGYNEGQFPKAVAESLSYMDPNFRPMTPEWRQVEEEIGIAMSNILTGQDEAAPALKKANDAIYEVYKEAEYYDK